MKSRALITSPLVFAITGLLLPVLSMYDIMSEELAIPIMIAVNAAVSIPLLIMNKTASRTAQEDKYAGAAWWLTVLTTIGVMAYVILVGLKDKQCHNVTLLSLGAVFAVVLINNIKAIYG